MYVSLPGFVAATLCGAGHVTGSCGSLTAAVPGGHRALS